MTRAYILCAAPRTGSTLMCRMLAAAGAGRPDSLFRREDLADWAAGWGLPVPAGGVAIDRPYLAAAIAEGTGASGIFGLRVMAETLPELLAALAPLFPDPPGDRARLEAVFGPLTFVHLARRDLLAQAVSLVRAQQTGLWHRAPDGTEIERTAPPQPPRYDRAAIAAALARLARAADFWSAWFAAQGIAPVALTYEDLAADPAATLRGLARRLDWPEPVPAALAPPVARLADATSAAWIARYRADCAAG